MTKRIRTTVIAALCAVLLACVGLGAWLLRSSAAEAEAAPAQNVGYSTVAVHDPSIVVAYEGADGKTYPTAEAAQAAQAAGGEADQSQKVYYVFGTQIAQAKSYDLINWTAFESNLSDNENLVAIIPANVRNYTGHGDNAASLHENCWAPDVIWNEAMGKWCMYLSVNGADNNSVIVLLISDDLDGAWSYMGEVVYSGFNNDNYTSTDYTKVFPEATVVAEKYNVRRGGQMSYSLNAIDAAVTYDENGDLWMSYGSWFGGIYMLKLDEATGLRDYTYTYENDLRDGNGAAYTGAVTGDGGFAVISDEYLGLHIAGGYQTPMGGEGSYSLKIGDWWYLFLSYGGLDPDKGYNMRVFRSATLTGFDANGDFVGYKDAAGNSPIMLNAITTMNGTKLNGTNGYDSQVGVRIMSGYTWSWWDYSYIAQGHNSAFVDGGKAYLVYHNKYTDGTIFHVLKVHELLVNADGWLVTSPFESTVQTTDVSSADELATGLLPADIAGTYGAVYMTRNNGTYSDVCRESKITLNSDGTISGDNTGDNTGEWTYDKKTGGFTIRTNVDNRVHTGYLIYQNLEGTNIRTLVFTAINTSGESISQYTYWGYKYPTAKQQIEYYLDTLGLPAEAHAASELPTGAHTATLWDKLSINISYNAETQSLTAVSGDTTVARTIALAAYETKTENVTLGAWTAMGDFYALSDGATITLSADITKEAGASAASDSFRGIYARIFVNGKTYVSRTAGTYHYLLRPDAPVKLESVLNADDAWQFWDASGIGWGGSMANATDYYLATSGKQTWTISLNDGILTAVVKFVKTGETEPMFETTFTVKEKLEKGAFIGFGTDTATASNAQVTIPTDSDYLPSEAERVNIPSWNQPGQAVWFDIYKNTSAVVEADVQMANASAWNGLLGHVYMNGTEYSFRPDFWIFTTEDPSGNNSQALVTKAATNLDLDTYKSNMAQGIHQKVTIGYANDSLVYKIESYFNNVKFGTVIYVAEVQGNPDFIRAEIYVDGATSTNATLVRPVLQGGHIHNYTESSRVGNDCTGDLVTYTCSCGDSYTATDFTGVVGHKYTVSATEATCTEPAKLTYTCSVCGDKFTAEVTPALGHDYGEPEWEWNGYASATATFTCTRSGCDHTENVTAVITNEVTTPATCESAGMRTYTATATFGEQKYTDTKTETIAVLGHDYGEPEWAWEGYTSATATFTCTRSGCTHTEEVTAIITNEVTTPATCEGTGVKTYTATATFGGEQYTDTNTETIAVLGHDYENVQPTWAWDGYTSAKATFKCTRCTHTEEVTATIESSVTTEATCEVTGVRTYAATVTFGEEQYTNDKAETIAALGHEWGTPVYAGTTLSASCTRADCTAVRSATVAFAAGDGTGEITALTATFDGTVFTVTLPNDGMTANEKGYLLTGWTVGEESYATNVQVEIAPGANGTFTAEYTMHEHSYTAVAEVPATCEKEGVKAHFTCTCGRLFVSDGEGYTEEQPADLVISALGHDYGEPEWAWEGYTSATATFTCMRSGCTHTEEVTAAITNEVTTPATCEGTGVRTYTATVTFGEQKYTDTKTEEIPTAAHTPEAVPGKEATCTEAGLTEGSKCSVCGEVLEEQEEIPAKGHSWGEWTQTKPATCTEKGVKTRACSACDATETADIDALGHDYENVQPTWTWDGYTSAKATFQCTRCTHTEEVTATIESSVTTDATCEGTGVKAYTATATFGGKQYTDDKTETVAALGHSWDEGSVTKPATCTEKGVKTFACTRDGCDKTRTEEIPAAGHTYSEEWLHDADGHWHKCEDCDAVTQTEAHVWGDWTTTKEATATENGSRSRECSVCGEEQSEVIPATGTQPAPDDDPADDPDDDPADDPDDDPDGSVSDEGLSDGAIAGIVIGCTVGALAIAYVVLAILFKKGIVKGAFFSRIFPFIK